MEDVNEDMFVIIIGDEEENISTEFQTPKVKIEQLEGDDLFVEDIIKTAEMHGEYLNMSEVKDPFIKEEPLSDCEYSNPVELSSVKIEFPNFLDIKVEPLDDPNDEDYIPNFDEDFDEEIQESEEHVTNSKQSKKILNFTAETKDDYSDEEYNSHSETGYGDSIGIYKRKNTERRTRMLKASEAKSFVKTLIVENPDLKSDSDLLVDLLFGIMKSIKAPPLPQIYYKSTLEGFMCIKCGAITKSEPAAGRHYQEHHGPRYLFCFACGVDFRSKTNLFKHEMRCRAPDISHVLKARAKYVGRKGRSRPFLDPTLPYCSQSSGTSNKSNDKKSSPRYHCDKCSASYSTQLGLMAHNYMHSGERPFLCAECSATYTSKSALLRHMKTHTDLKYICDHCKQEFKAKAALVVHLNRHLPQKPFPCNECPKRFAQKMALTLHVNRVHRNLPPPCACQLCPKRYPRMSVLKEHMKKVHGMTLVTRMMLYKSLTKMPQSLIQHGKVVLESEVAYFKDDKIYENKTHSTENNDSTEKEYDHEDFLRQIAPKTEEYDHEDFLRQITPKRETDLEIIPEVLVEDYATPVEVAADIGVEEITADQIDNSPAVLNHESMFEGTDNAHEYVVYQELTPDEEQELLAFSNNTKMNIDLKSFTIL